MFLLIYIVTHHIAKLVHAHCVTVESMISLFIVTLYKISGMAPDRVSANNVKVNGFTLRGGNSSFSIFASLRDGINS